MLNNRSVRLQLEEVRAARKALKDRDEVLESIEASLLRWLDLAEVGTPLPLSAPGRLPLNLPEAPPKDGKVLLKDAVLLVLRNRAGTVMSSEEIFQAAKALGASSRSSKPTQVIEWILQEAQKFANAPIKKTAPHRYVWVQEEGPRRATAAAILGGDL